MLIIFKVPPTKIKPFVAKKWVGYSPPSLPYSAVPVISGCRHSMVSMGADDMRKREFKFSRYRKSRALADLMDQSRSEGNCLFVFLCVVCFGLVQFYLAAPASEQSSLHEIARTRRKITCKHTSEEILPRKARYKDKYNLNQFTSLRNIIGHSQ